MIRFIVTDDNIGIVEHLAMVKKIDNKLHLMFDNECNFYIEEDDMDKFLSLLQSYKIVIDYRKEKKE